MITMFPFDKTQSSTLPYGRVSAFCSLLTAYCFLGTLPYGRVSAVCSRLTAYCSGRRCGNRITSRIECLFASSITRRSMPTPMPAAGGIP